MMSIKTSLQDEALNRTNLGATSLRREMTLAEKTAKRVGRIAPCGALRRANKLGVHFRRQQIIQGFIVDFYCPKVGLVVEVDGDIHDLQQEEDARREKVLREMGLRACAEPVEALSAFGTMRL
jgi:very-short-patch-repair endonuclease